MLICKTLGYVHFPIFENALTKLQNDVSRLRQQTKLIKIHSIEFKVHLYKVFHIQKYLNLRFKPNGEVRSHIAYVSIQHFSSIENTSNFLIVFPIPTIKDNKTISSHELSHADTLHL
jgi:hypothetical protein